MHVHFSLQKSLVLLIALTLSLAAWSQADYRVVPRPQRVAMQPEESPFRLSAQTVIVHEKDNVAKRNAQHLQEFIAERTGLRLKLQQKCPRANAIVLTSRLRHDNNEAYHLRVGSAFVSIEGASHAGTFYGIQTLRKSLPHRMSISPTSEVVLPAVHIDDAPRFAYRGAHLDVARHFVAPDSVRRFIDMIALHNINRFHWHLTDDQGWRIEIKKHPRLTQLGAVRSGTVIGKNWGNYDNIPYGGFYTQQECRDIVAYAAARHVTIIPEIDMPGHMQGALKAYPELGCTGGPYEVWRTWGVSEDVLCAGNPKTYDFIDDVLDEVVKIFPSTYIHVGGDECPKTRWKACPKCQKFIQQHQLQADGTHSAEERLQSHIIRHAEAHLAKLGRKMIGWDETLEGGLAPGATVMSWRGEAGGLEAARHHHDAIMTPNSYLYFDYYQTKNTNTEPLAIGGYLPLQQVYSYEPVPNSCTPEEAQHIIGVQANLWTEYIRHFAHIEYMELPRMAALAEIQWTPRGTKDYSEFTTRLPRLLQLYSEKNYNYARHIYDITANYRLEPGRGIVVQLSTIDNAAIRYTLDGSDPTAHSPLYTAPVVISSDAKFRAAAFRPREHVGTSAHTERSHIEGEDFCFSRSTARKISLLQGCNAQYRFAGANTLVDGLTADNTNYQTGRWLGFNREEMEAVVDFGAPTTFQKISFNTIVEKGSWVYDARRIVLAFSQDGEHFTTLLDNSYPPLDENHPNGISPHVFDISPTTARYLKVIAVPEKSIPNWHTGAAGHPAFLFVDEIVVH